MKENGETLNNGMDENEIEDDYIKLLKSADISMDQQNESQTHLNLLEYLNDAEKE